LYRTGGPQRLGEGRALGGIIGGTGVHGQVRRFLAEGALVGGRGHEGVVADIVLDDAGHGHRVGGGRGVAQIVLLGEGDGIARRKPQLHRELLGNDRPLGRQRHRLAACALAEVPQVLESRGILGGHDGGHGLGTVGALGDHGGLRGAHRHGQLRRIGQDGVGRLPRTAVGIGLLAYHHVVVHQLAVLHVDDVVDGVLQPQARQQQRRAAGDADHGHDQAPLVAEDIAKRHLP
jgi:hypothetical protein